MDLNTLLTVGISAVSTLAIAYLGHTAASVTLSKAIAQLASDLGAGLNPAALAKDAKDVEEVVEGAKAVLNDKPK